MANERLPDSLPRERVRAEIDDAARATSERPDFPSDYVDRVHEQAASFALRIADPDDIRAAIALLEEQTNVDAMAPIEARNQAVVQDLKAELKKKKPPKSISVLYGAGHMEDMEKRMQSELRYRPADHFWLTAFSVNLEQSGLTEADVEMVRGLIRWQMEMLQHELK